MLGPGGKPNHVRFGYPTIVALLAIAVRSTPIYLGWPYPVGFDTTAYYLPMMIKGIPGLSWVFHNFSLQQLILSSVYSVYPNAFVALSVFAIVVQIALGLLVYQYAISVRLFSEKISFLTSTMFTFSIVTLRLTWDQYRMALALAFTLATLIALNSRTSKAKYLAVPFVLLVTLSNALPAVLLLFSMLIHIVVSHRDVGALKAEISSCVAGFAVVGLQEFSLGSNNMIGTSVPIAAVPLSIGFLESAYGLLFLLATSWPALVLVPIALRRKRIMRHDGYFLYLILLFALVPTAVGLYVVPPVVVYWMASFPLSIIFGLVLTNSARWTHVVALAMLVLTVTSGFGYVTSSSLAPEPYFTALSGYAQYLPVGYLQSTVPIAQEGRLVQVLNQSLRVLPKNSTLLVAQQFYGLVLMLPDPNQVNVVNVGQIGNLATSTPPLPILINVVPMETLGSMHGYYTIWWTQPNNWYGVSQFPLNFHVWMNNGDFSIFLIE